jgi:N-acetylneuraminic acid mutarotase
MKGADTAGEAGTYGTLGTAAAANTPGARDSSSSWTDASGNLWLFGGWGYDSAGNGDYLSDLWKYNRSTGYWTWMKGADVALQPGVYGTLGTAAAANVPGARSQAAAWTDSSGNLWLFGGYGQDGAGNQGTLGDLWKYDPSTGYWTWMKGSSTVNQLGTYGTLGTAAAANNPGSRFSSVAWVDPSGVLWLFGGYIYDGASSAGPVNDLWKYDPGTGKWAWMKGASTTGQSGTYGTLGVAAVANTPGARYGSVAWTDPTGALWLFGGKDFTGSTGEGSYNDLWKYDRATGNWAWMKGADTANQSGTYGTLGTPAAANTPGAREDAVSWTDLSGSLWLFGGYNDDGTGNIGGLFNDLWKYDRATGYWTWMKGSSAVDQSGIYGTLGTPAAENTPGARSAAVSWTDPSGALWLFGGAFEDDQNCLWRATLPEAGPPTGTILINNNQSVTNSPNVTLNLSWSGGAGTGVNRMKFSNDNVTWTAWETVAATKSWTLPAGEGYKTVRVMYRDSEGNNSIVFSDYIRVDTTAPTGSILINNNQSVTNNANATLSLAWSDGAGSGVARMRFSNDGATWSVWETPMATKAWTLPIGDGYKTVRVQYRDAAGNNSTTYNDYIRVDTTPPTGSILINGGLASTQTRAVSLGLTWSDGTGSGVSQMRFSIDGATWTAWEPAAAIKLYALPATPGYYTVRVTFRDAAGNISERFSDYIKLLAP